MSEQAVMNYTPTQLHMMEVMQQHMVAEFVTKDVEAALATMTEDAYVLNIPVLSGGVGRDTGVREFYANYFVPSIPPDFETTVISMTASDERLVTEGVAKFTHSIAMDWMLPGIAPTGKVIEIVVIGIIGFRNGKMSYEHLYWDQATVLVQLGLIDAAILPVTGAESAHRLLRKE